MGKSEKIPAMNEVVFFLKKFAPDKANHITNLGQEYALELKEGVYGGTSSPQENEEIKNLRIKCYILHCALEETLPIVEERTNAIRGKLKKIRILRFTTAASSAFFSLGSVLTALLNDNIRTILLATATLVTNIANIAISTLIIGHGKSEPGLVEYVQSLTKAKLFANLTIKFLAAAGNDMLIVRSELSEIIREANVQYRQINELLAKSTE